MYIILYKPKDLILLTNLQPALASPLADGLPELALIKQFEVAILGVNLRYQIQAWVVRYIVAIIIIGVGKFGVGEPPVDPLPARILRRPHVCNKCILIGAEGTQPVGVN